MKRLERKAIVKHKWQTRWMRLDSQYLSVYGSAAEASKDKSGKLALQQYRLYDLEEVALARNIHGMVTIPNPQKGKGRRRWCRCRWGDMALTTRVCLWWDAIRKSPSS